MLERLDREVVYCFQSIFHLREIHFIYESCSRLFLVSSLSSPVAAMLLPKTSQRPFVLLCLLLLVLVDTLTAFRVTGALGGVNTTTGVRPLRYEIHKFATPGPAFDLLILSLMAFQAANQSNPLSYFQISGT